jgi:hypothetical protein
VSKLVKNTALLGTGGFLLWWWLSKKTYGAGTILGGGAGNTNNEQLATSPAKLGQIIQELDRTGTGTMTKIQAQGLRISIPAGTSVVAGLISSVDDTTSRTVINYNSSGQSFRIKNIYYQAAGAKLIVETKPLCALELIITPTGSKEGQICETFLFELTGSQRGFIKR